MGRASLHWLVCAVGAGWLAVDLLAVFWRGLAGCLTQVLALPGWVPDSLAKWLALLAGGMAGWLDA